MTSGNIGQLCVRDGPNTVSESTVSNTELSEFFGAHRVPGRELSEFLSAYYLCAKANSPSFSQNSPSLPQNSVRLSEVLFSETVLSNSTLETVFRPFPSVCSQKPSRIKNRKQTPKMGLLGILDPKVLCVLFWAQIGRIRANKRFQGKISKFEPKILKHWGNKRHKDN